MALLQPFLLLLLAATASSGSSFAAIDPALRVPSNLAALAQPIWVADTGIVTFAMARSEFTAKTLQLHSAVAFVTAQQSPYCTPDPRLIHNDYGSCVPHGGDCVHVHVLLTQRVCV